MYIDPVAANWQKSSHCNGASSCVEVVQTEDAVGLRDGKDPKSPVLVFSKQEWAAFIAGAKDGECDF